MPARSVKKRSYNKSKKSRKGRKTRKQIGGNVFSEAQLTELGTLGFNDEQKNALARHLSQLPPGNIMGLIRHSLQQINPQTGQPFTPQGLIDSLDEDDEPMPPRTEGGKRRRKSRKQRGGTVFSEEQLTELGTFGFNDEQKKELGRRWQMEPTIAMILIRNFFQHNNPQNGEPYTPQEFVNSFIVAENNNDNELSDIENDSDDEHSLSDFDEELMSDDEEPMTPPRRTEGGKRRRKSRKQRGGTDFTNVRNELNNLGIVEDDDIRKLSQFYTVGPNDAIDTIRNYLRLTYPGQAAPYTRTQIQAFIQTLNNNGVMGRPQQVAMPVYGPDGGRRRRKTRKMKGGALYGTGVGANNFDPNYSIYNTRELTLFPYKPN